MSPTNSMQCRKHSCVPPSSRALDLSREQWRTVLAIVCLCPRGIQALRSGLVARCSTDHCTHTAACISLRLPATRNSHHRPIGSASSNAGLAAALRDKALYTLSSATPTRAFTFRCAALIDSSVHLVLVWSDPSGHPAALKQLVNDLDLIVFVGNGSRVFGNTGSYADTSNTVEKAVVNCPSASIITAIVTTASTLYTNSQTFALVANGNVFSEFAREVNVPAFSPGRPTSIPTSSRVCGEPEDLVRSWPIKIAAPMQFKNPTFRFPRSKSAMADLVSHFTASLAMFLGVPEYSIGMAEFTSGPWIGFACGSYICSASSTAAPCYLVFV